MATYSIPLGYRRGFQRLADLGSADFERLAAAVEAPSASADMTVVSERVAASASLGADDVTEILSSVFSAAALRSREGISGAVMARSLNLDDITADSDEVRARIARLLDSPAVRLTVRAADLVAADERLLLATRIVTDLRPVFPDPDEGPQEGPLAATASLVVHLLRVEYLENGETKTFVVAMDNNDLRKLREALDRAERKAISIADLAKLASLPVLSQPVGGTEE